jgi:transposase
MKKAGRPRYTREFKLESAQLVVDEDYTINEAADAMGVSISSMNNWIKKLRAERQGKTPIGLALTPEQHRIKELERQVKRIELEKEILKKATALLMSDSMKSLR